MPEFVVTEGCYVPVGTGKKFKPAGTLVTLNAKQARELKGFVEAVGGAEGDKSEDSKTDGKADDKSEDSKPDTKPDDK